jgi:HEAT repeat protein
MSQKECAVWRWLHDLGDPEQMVSRRLHAWSCLLHDGVLADACRQALTAGETQRLRTAWDSVAQDDVATLVHDSYKPAANTNAPLVEAGRLLCGVRGTLAVALGALQAREAVPDLLQALRHDKDGWVRAAAARALGAMQAREAVPDLLQALRQDKDSWAREAAVQALGQLEKLLPEGVNVASAGPDIERELTAWNADLQRLLPPAEPCSQGGPPG